MSIEIAVDQDQNLTTLIVNGLVTAQEMHHALESIYTDGPTAFILWDMSKCDLSVVTPDELHDFTQKAAQLGGERKEGLTAIIAPEDLHPAFTTLAKLFTRVLPFRLKVFSSRAEALAWLFAD